MAYAIKYTCAVVFLSWADSTTPILAIAFNVGSAKSLLIWYSIINSKIFADDEHANITTFQIYHYTTVTPKIKKNNCIIYFLLHMYGDSRDAYMGNNNLEV